MLVKNNIIANKVEYTRDAGAMKATGCMSTGKKVMFIKDGKKVTRVVHTNQRGTKLIKYNDAWILLSKVNIKSNS